MLYIYIYWYRNKITISFAVKKYIFQSYTDEQWNNRHQWLKTFLLDLQYLPWFYSSVTCGHTCYISQCLVRVRVICLGHVWFRFDMKIHNQLRSPAISASTNCFGEVSYLKATWREAIIFTYFHATYSIWRHCCKHSFGFWRWFYLKKV